MVALREGVCSVARLHLFVFVAFELLFVFGFEFARHFVCSLLDSSDTDFVVAVALFDVAHGEEGRVFHLLFLFFHFLVKLWVEHFQGRNSVVALRLHGVTERALAAGSHLEIDRGLVTSLSAEGTLIL